MLLICTRQKMEGGYKLSNWFCYRNKVYGTGYFGGVGKQNPSHAAMP